MSSLGVGGRVCGTALLARIGQLSSRRRLGTIDQDLPNAGLQHLERIWMRYSSYFVFLGKIDQGLPWSNRDPLLSFFHSMDAASLANTPIHSGENTQVVHNLLQYSFLHSCNLIFRAKYHPDGAGNRRKQASSDNGLRLKSGWAVPRVMAWYDREEQNNDREGQEETNCVIYRQLNNAVFAVVPVPSMVPPVRLVFKSRDLQ